MRQEAEKDLDELIGTSAADLARSGSTTSEVASSDMAVYSEYLPMLLHQNGSLMVRSFQPISVQPCIQFLQTSQDPNRTERLDHKLTEFPTLDAAMDEFFSKAESQKADLKDLKEKEAAWQKVERVKDHHRSQVVDLKITQTLNERKAQLIEENFEVCQSPSKSFHFASYTYNY